MLWHATNDFSHEMKQCQQSWSQPTHSGCNKVDLVLHGPSIKTAANLTINTYWSTTNQQQLLTQHLASDATADNTLL